VVFLLLKFAIQEFREDREMKNLSERSLKSYSMLLKEFQAFCSGMNVLNITDVTMNVVRKYLIYLQQERNNNPTSRNSKLQILKAFFNHLEFVEIIESKYNPTKKLGYVKEDIKIEVFSDNQIKQMLTYFRRMKHRDKSFYSYRDYMIVVFLLGTGCRLGELVNITWKDTDLRNGVVTIIGKKREQSSIPMTEKLVKELCEYRVFCEQYYGKLSDYVFTDHTNQEKLHIDAVKSLFRRLKEIMDFKDVRLSAHTFRHTFAHRCLMAGMDIFSLQKMLRHSQISNTQRYLAIWGTALKEQNDKYNPLNNIDV
jgi:integrase/recombinase XerD